MNEWIVVSISFLKKLNNSLNYFNYLGDSVSKPYYNPSKLH